MTNNKLNLNNSKGDVTIMTNNKTVLNDNNKIKLSGDDKLMLNELKELNRTYVYLNELEAMYDLDNIDDDKHDMIYDIFYNKYISLIKSIKNSISDDKALVVRNDKYILLDVVKVNLDTLEYDLDEYRSISTKYEINCIGIIRNKSTKYIAKPKLSTIKGRMFHEVKSFREYSNNALVAKLFYNDEYVIRFSDEVIEYVVNAYNEQKSCKESTEDSHITEHYSYAGLNEYFDNISRFTCESLEEVIYMRYKMYKTNIDEIVKFCSNPSSEDTFSEVKKLIKRFNFEMKLTSDYNTTVSEFAKMYKDYVNNDSTSIVKEFIVIRELSFAIKDILAELDCKTTFAILRQMSREMFFFDADTYYAILDAHETVREDRKLDYISDYLIDEFELATIFGWTDYYYYY